VQNDEMGRALDGSKILTGFSGGGGEIIEREKFGRPRHRLRVILK
jgi:hypothetical protein